MSGVIQLQGRSHALKKPGDISLDYRSGKDMPLRDALKLMQTELNQLAEKTQSREPECAESLKN
ncbi:MAG: hypothetical protein P8Y20_01135, partial [Gammaproteobacteria bacterium]